MNRRDFLKWASATTALTIAQKDLLAQELKGLEKEESGFVSASRTKIPLFTLSNKKFEKSEQELRAYEKPLAKVLESFYREEAVATKKELMELSESEDGVLRFCKEDGCNYVYAIGFGWLRTPIFYE